MKFLVFGSLNIDLTFRVDHIARPGETISSLSVQKNAGGKGANQAAALAKAGMPVYFAGKIGNDGVWILDLLKSFGVNVDCAVVSPHVSSGQAIIQLDSARQNAIVLNAGGNKLLESAEIERILSRFEPGDMLVLQNEINAIGEIMAGAKKRGMKICFNPSPFDESIRALPLELVDYFFVNEIEAQQILGIAEKPEKDADFRSLAPLFSQQFPETRIIMTAGKKGSYYIEGKTVLFADIVDAPVVDTTGAGDTFTGFFLAALYKNLDPSCALAAASKAASLAVSRAGAMEAIPIHTQVW